GLRLWNIGTAPAQRGAALRNDDAVGRLMAFTADDSLLVTGDDNGRVALWDAAGGARTGGWDVLPGPTAGLMIMPGSRRVIAVSASQAAQLDVDRLLLADTRNEPANNGKKEPIQMVDVSPDGQLLAVAHRDDGKVTIWNIGERRAIGTLQLPG